MAEWRLTWVPSGYAGEDAGAAMRLEFHPAMPLTCCWILAGPCPSRLRQLQLHKGGTGWYILSYLRVLLASARDRLSLPLMLGATCKVKPALIYKRRN